MISTLLTVLLLQKSYCNNVVSNENDSNNARRESADKYTANVDVSARRFIEDLDEKEWYVAHLKDTGFFRKSACVGETIEDKFKKYRRALKEDGGRVEYVMAHTLPFDEKDLLKRESCVAPNITNSADGRHINDNNENDGDVTDEVNTATTIKTKSLKADGLKSDNMTAEEKSRRASEYQFSSTEYYDETVEFDDEICPDDVEVITLEMDQLRNYDVECEKIVEWRSLDN